MTEKIDHQKVQDYSLEYSEALMSKFFTSEKNFILGNEILVFSEVKQVNFFIMKSLFMNWQQEIKRLKSPYFDYEHPESKEAMNNFMNTLSRHIKIGQKELLPLVIAAVQETIYLLISPFEFFYADFSQMGSQEINVDFLKKESKYIKINKPLMQALIKEIESSHGNSASQDEVISILESLLNEEGLMEDPTDSLSHFSATVAIEKNDLLLKVPEEKTSIEVPQEEINISAPADMENESSEGEISSKSFFETEMEEVPKEKPQVSKEQNTSNSSPQTVITDEENISDIEEDLGIEPLEDEKQSNLSGGSLNDNYSSPVTVLNDTLKEKDAEPLAEVLEKQSNQETLLNTMSINHGYMFINELFKGNADEFNLAMERIEVCKDFDSAVELLVQKYARPFNWDMNSKEVKELLKVIFRRFR